MMYHKYENHGTAALENYKELFLLPEQDTGNFNARIMHAISQNETHFKQFLKSTLVAYSTVERTPEIEDKMVQIVNSLITVDPKVDVEITDDSLTINDGENTIHVSRMSDLYKNILTEKALQELISRDRLKKCHYRSYSLALSPAFEDCFLVTGKISTCTPTTRYLHTWIETKTENGEWLALDYTKNSVMKRDEYYKQFSAKPYSVLSHSQLKEDYKYANMLIQNQIMGMKQYLLFRDAIADAINNQKNIVDTINREQQKIKTLDEVVPQSPEGYQP